MIGFSDVPNFQFAQVENHLFSFWCGFFLPGGNGRLSDMGHVLDSMACTFLLLRLAIT